MGGRFAAVFFATARVESDFVEDLVAAAGVTAFDGVAGFVLSPDVEGSDRSDEDDAFDADLVSAAFGTRLLATFFTAFAFGSGATSTAGAAGVLRRALVAGFFAGPLAGLVAGLVVEVSSTGVIAGGADNGSSPVMASVDTSSLRVAPVSCGGWVGLAMAEV